MTNEQIPAGTKKWNHTLSASSAMSEQDVLVSFSPALAKLQIDIVLSHGTFHVYHPGSTISGLVLLSSPVNEEVRDLSIHLQGYTNISYGANAESIKRTGVKSAEDTVSFFPPIHETLFQGPDFPAEVCRGGQVHQWPFELTLVDSTVQDLSSQRTTTREEVFETKPHTLPPSLHFEQANISGGNYYELEVKLTRPTGKGASFSQVQPILFNMHSDAMASLKNVYRYPRGLLGRGGNEDQPVRLAEMRAISFLATLPFSSSSPVTAQGGRSASLPSAAQRLPRPRRRSSIFSSFSSSPPSVPLSATTVSKVRCTVDVSLPKIIPLTRTFPINVTLTHDATASVSQPPVSIHAVKLYLMMLTHWRVPNPSPMRPRAAYIRVTRQSQLLASASELSLSLKSGSITDLGPVLSDPTLEEATPLPFKSYCITRDYSVGVHLDLRTGSDEVPFVANLELPVKLANKLREESDEEIRAGRVETAEPLLLDLDH